MLYGVYCFRRRCSSVLVDQWCAKCIREGGTISDARVQMHRHIFARDVSVDFTHAVQRVYAYPNSSVANTVCPNLPSLTRGSRTFWVPAGGFRPRYYRYIPPRWSSLIVSHTVLPRPVCEVAFATPRENPSVSSLCENCIIPFVLCIEKSERSRSSGIARYETSDWSGLEV